MNATDNTGNFRKTIVYHYKFKLNNGELKEFRVALDSSTLNLIKPEIEIYPEWAELNFFKCPHCPLEELTDKYCPLAISLTNLVKCFSKAVSYEEVDVIVETEERKYEKHTTLQKGLSPLIGLYMVTSGCPVMNKLKPMVRHHLPFATEDETKYRVLSMYLLAQFFLQKRGEKPDWEMKRLVKIYEDVRIVNKNISKRLAGIKIEDANINALVILDCFADSVNFSLYKDMLDEIEILFNAYF